MILAANIGLRMKAARKLHGLTQREVGERCGIAESTIRQYEHGRLNPKIETVQKIANAFGVDFFVLCPACDNCPLRQKGSDDGRI